MELSPESIFSELNKSVIGQERYLRDLSTAAWLHHIRYRHFIETGEQICRPKQNILCLGPSGTGKTLAVQTIGNLLGLPVLIEDASALRGAGWKGTNVSNIVQQAYNAAQDEEDAQYCIICLDEIDKVFRSRASSDFLPIDNLLTFLCGNIITHTENSRTISLDTSNFLIICLGAFEGLDKIISRRLADGKNIGFGAVYKKPPSDILHHVTEDDLREYGIPREFLGRITLLTQTEPLDRSSYQKILTESDVSPVRHLDRLLCRSLGIRVFISDAAVRYISEKAEESGTGARMLTRTVSEALHPAVFRLGSSAGISSLVLDYNSGGLFVSEHHSRMSGRQGIISRIPEIERHLLESVPFSCMHVKGKIVACAEKIKKISSRSSALPPNYISAATYVLAAAICLTLSDDEEIHTMLDLYASVCAIQTGQVISLPHPLFQMHREFADMAEEFVKDTRNAAKIARQIIHEYCSIFLEKQARKIPSAGRLEQS